MEKLTKILIIDDEEGIRDSLSIILAREGYDIKTAENSYQALELMRGIRFDILLLDIKMPGMDGLTLLKKIRDEHLLLRVVMMSGFGTVNTAVKAIKLGADDYISKPFKRDEVLLTLKKLEERGRLRLESRLHINNFKQIVNFEGMLSSNPKMLNIFENIKKIAPYKTSVLITGESGTGKELIAKAIHAKSTRSNGPLIAINCGAIPSNLLESELFGFEKGAFTDAKETKKGLFEVADNGTIFLDEIGDMDISLQVKLLRVIQDRTVRRVGGGKNIPVDVRIVSATLENLQDDIKIGMFREDLFYRLNVVHIEVPPLRERRSDIPALISYFMEKYNCKYSKNINHIDKKAIDYLLSCPWKGNVRELENVIERGVLFCSKAVITPEHIKLDSYSSNGKGELILPLKAAHEKFEREMINSVLTQTKGNKKKAAKLLGISYRSLLYKIKDLFYTD